MAKALGGKPLLTFNLKNVARAAKSVMAWIPPRSETDHPFGRIVGAPKILHHPQTPQQQLLAPLAEIPGTDRHTNGVRTGISHFHEIPEIKAI